MSVIKAKQKLSGFILPLVLFVFLLASIVSIFLFKLSNQNTYDILTSEYHQKAYYIANTGVELANAALVDTKTGKTIIDVYKTKTITDEPIKTTVFFDSECTIIEKSQYDTLKYRGKSDISLRKVFSDKKNWVEVTSIGTISTFDGKNISKQIVFKVNLDRPEEIVYDKVNNDA